MGAARTKLGIVNEHGFLVASFKKRKGYLKHELCDMRNNAVYVFEHKKTKRHRYIEIEFKLLRNRPPKEIYI